MSHMEVGNRSFTLTLRSGILSHPHESLWVPYPYLLGLPTVCALPCTQTQASSTAHCQILHLLACGLSQQSSTK